MNKPETKPAQSLEEILASIRKALAEEEAPGETESPTSAEATATVDERQAAPAKSDRLSGQLAVALNGSGSGETFADDDLADLLAPVPSKEPSAPAEEAAPSQPAEAEQKDPLWFLARQPAPSGEPGQPATSEEALKPSGDEDTTASREDEEAALTRLETLRSTVPPLFGSGEGPATETEPVSGAQPTPAPKPVEPPQFAAPDKDKAKDDQPETKAPPPEKAAASPATSPEPAAAPAAAATTPPSGSVPHPPGSAMSEAETMASTLEEARRRTLKESPAVAAQARALEGMIGQLLEPVIRNWLETNLPRLVEKVVREEVARVTADKPDAIDT